MKYDQGKERYKTVFRDNASDTLKNLKQTYRIDELHAKGIPLKNNNGMLIPMCELHIDDELLINDLAKWRHENSFAYPSRFPVTLKGTKVWLRKQVLDNSERILFLVLDKYGNRIGHLGYTNCLSGGGEIEIDNVVRGVKDTNLGIMANSMEVLINWAEEILLAESIVLRVLDDNKRAIAFYQRLGFTEIGRIPLRERNEEDRFELIPLDANDIAKPDRYFLQMTYTSKTAIDKTQTIMTAGPSISSRECAYAADAVRYGWNSQWNKYIHKFEKKFAEYIGTKFALATSSCTGALHMALLSLDIGPGDEVIVPDITWVASAQVVNYVGATPIFGDVHPESWTLDPNSFESIITEKTKAVIPVHLYGHPAEMDRIMKIAKKHNLYVIEDAAPSIGAEFKGQKTGTFGDFAAFSFQGAKLAVTGEGGMIVTDNEELFRKFHKIWDQGRIPGTFWIDQVGWKYKMSNIQAAVGLGQLERVDMFIEAKRRIFSWYADGLKDVSSIRLNYEMPWARSIYWMTSIFLNENAIITRDEMIQSLKERNIDSRPVFPAISQYPIWPGNPTAKSIALRIGRQAINLPSGVRLKREQVDYICESIKSILKW